MIVKRVKSVEGGDEKGEKGAVDAGALRRLGFEVGEWVRSR